MDKYKETLDFITRLRTVGIKASHVESNSINVILKDNSHYLLSNDLQTKQDFKANPDKDIIFIDLSRKHPRIESVWFLLEHYADEWL